MGSRLSRANNLFIGLTILGFASFSTWFWFSFPFDNLCKDKEVSAVEIFGKNLSTTIATSEDSLIQTYKYCEQRLTFSQVFRGFSREDLEWMTDKQFELVRIYNATALVIFIGFISVSVAAFIHNVYNTLFVGIGKVSIFFLLHCCRINVPISSFIHHIFSIFRFIA